MLEPTRLWIRPPCDRVRRSLGEAETGRPRCCHSAAEPAARPDGSQVVAFPSHEWGVADRPAPIGTDAASPCWKCLSRRAPSPSPDASRALLEQIIRQDVLPRLGDRSDSPRPGAALPALEEAAIRLVQRLLAPSLNLAEAIEQVEEIGRPFGWTAIGCAGLFERSARLLGDRWQQDVCNDLDVTLALGTLQAALHSMPLAPATPFDTAERTRRVLVATFPGELHHLGAALDRDALGLAGWTVTSDCPANAEALQRLVGAQWLDALDLTLSSALRREHWLPRLAATIAGAREASCNPRLVVTVGGRLFTEERDAWTSVGADAGSVSAAALRPSIEAALRQARVDWPSQTRLAS